MSNYREKLEAQLVIELREWLDTIEERFGPNFALETYGFLAAVGHTPEGDEPEDAHDSFARSAVGFHCSDTRAYVQNGLLRQALQGVESNDDD